MNVYVVLGRIHYEGDELLGVFDTKAKASAEVAVRKGGRCAHDYHDYVITEMELR